MSYALRIPYDDAVLLASSQTREEFEKEARFLLAAKLFDLGRLSSGKAAELCGMARAQFLLSLERVGVSALQLRPEDLDDEVAFAENGPPSFDHADWEAEILQRAEAAASGAPGIPWDEMRRQMKLRTSREARMA